MKNIDIVDARIRSLNASLEKLEDLTSYEWMTMSTVVLPALRELNSRLEAVEVMLNIRQIEDVGADPVPENKLILPVEVHHGI